MTGLVNRIPETAAGLAPLTGPEPRILILGSFPSVLSLAHHEYYGNPRNRFWAVIAKLYRIPATLPYAERTLRLTNQHIALWDVISTCSRPGGSADSRIRNPVPNDLAGFAREHPSIRLIALNGSMAGRSYHRLAQVPGIPSIILPSTSPANAAMAYAEKVRAWEVLRDECNRD